MINGRRTLLGSSIFSTHAHYFSIPAHLPSPPSSLLTPVGKGFPEVEDELNWHGKPLGDKTDAALEACRKAIKNPKVHLTVKAFTDDAPKVELPQIKLSNPPDYKLGDMVSVFGPIVLGMGMTLGV